MNVILSIHPKWAKLIYEGCKKFEWRKSRPKDLDITVFIYETTPVKKITGYFHYNEIYTLNTINKEFSHLDPVVNGCVSVEELIKYRNNKGKLYAWGIRNPVKLGNPMTIEDFKLNRPPQSWCYTFEDKEDT